MGATASPSYCSAAASAASFFMRGVVLPRLSECMSTTPARRAPVLYAVPWMTVAPRPLRAGCPSASSRSTWRRGARRHAWCSRGSSSLAAVRTRWRTSACCTTSLASSRMPCLARAPTQSGPFWALTAFDRRRHQARARTAQRANTHSAHANDVRACAPARLQRLPPRQQKCPTFAQARRVTRKPKANSRGRLTHWKWRAPSAVGTYEPSRGRPAIPWWRRPTVT